MHTYSHEFPYLLVDAIDFMFFIFGNVFCFRLLIFLPHFPRRVWSYKYCFRVQFDQGSRVVESMSALFSTQVTCFEYADQLLPREDPDAAKCLEGALLEDGLDIRLGIEDTGSCRNTLGLLLEIKQTSKKQSRCSETDTSGDVFAQVCVFQR